MRTIQIGKLMQDGLEIWFVLATCVLFILTTFLLGAHLGMPPVLIDKSNFHLGYENNLATWFSGIIFFVAALHALDGYFLNTESDRRLAAFAWCVIAGLLTALSADELGSIHERLDNNIAPFMYKSLPLYPFLLGFTALFFAAVLLLLRHREFRRNIVLLLAGFAILATVPLQEYWEHTLDWNHSQLVSGFRVAVEEGSELVGALFILAACMPNTKLLPKRISGCGGDWFLATTNWHKWFSIASLCLLIPLVTLFSAFIDEERARGYPASWFTAVLFFVAGINGIKTLASAGHRDTQIDWLFVVLCLTASAGFVMVPPHERTEFLFDSDLSKRALLLGAFVLAFGVVRLFRRFGTISFWWVLYPGFVLIAVASLQSNSRLVLFLLPCLLALLVYYDEKPELAKRERLNELH